MDAVGEGRRLLSSGPAALRRTLAWLRLCVLVGQSAAIAISDRMLGIALPEAKLWPMLAAYALFAVWAFTTVRREGDVAEWRALAHLAVDSAVLGWLLYWTGGAANPFVSLYLVPVTLVATALSARATTVVAIVTALGYGGLLLWPAAPVGALLGAGAHASHHDAHPADGLAMHLVGMWVNFVLSAALLAIFLGGLARRLRAQHTQLRAARERALRDSTLLALAGQAATAAHAMNTPLATLATLLGELRRTRANDARLRDDFALMDEQLQRCRVALADMAEVARGGPQAARVLSASMLLRRAADTFRVLRPEVRLVLILAPDAAEACVSADATLAHALVNLLDNAADASHKAGRDLVEASLARDGDALIIDVRDHGAGLVLAPVLGTSDKPHGWGLGLPLAELAAERSGGGLSVEAAGPGTRVRLRLREASP